MRQELFRYVEAVNVFIYYRHAACLMTELRNVVRIRQEAHVPNHVCIHRHTVLEAKAQYRYRQTLTVIVGRFKGFTQILLQVCRLHLRRVDNIIGAMTNGFQNGTFLLETGSNASFRRQRMTAARFLVAAHQRFIGSIHEYDFVRHLHGFQRRQRIGQRIKELAAANIYDQSHTAQTTARLAAHFAKLRYEHRRQIIYTKIAHIFQSLHNLRLAGAGHACHYEQPKIRFHTLAPFYFCKPCNSINGI